MSLLNQLFNRGVFAGKCKTCLSLAISRIKLLQNKRDLQLKHMRKEIAQFLQTGQQPIARIRVEHVIREQNVWAAYEILELFCEFVLARVPIIESQRECPVELREAIASIIFAAPRCSDLPDLLQLKNLFAVKYGKEFVFAISELRPDSGVNRSIIEKLSVSAPPGELKLKVMKEIAQEHGLNWDSSSTASEFSKTHEDLLGGPKVVQGAAASQTPQHSSSNPSIPYEAAHPAASPMGKQEPERHHTFSPISNITSEIKAGHKQFDVKPEVAAKLDTRPPPSDVLEKAKAAIASAERATAAARVAAELANVKLGAMKFEGGQTSEC
ncbi:IST1 homolog [Benincasa hispida]|uniref:IST1 homolog n=1 Tax=Benincasa hispida TaxID=102211 RepID=UPI0019020607|nr:IST1 homolog [Benincasa hispida]